MNTETSIAIWSVLLRTSFPDVRNTENQWKKIASDFSAKSNFPHAIVVLDGKHTVMQAPHNFVSAYFNYKKTQRVVFSCFF